MAIHYKTCADPETTALVHTCDACNDREHARIRSVILIKPGTTINVPLVLSEWKTAIEAGNIHIIPNTKGSLDDSPITGDGYGDESSVNLGHDYTLNFNDPAYVENKEFYEGAEKLKWLVGWRTETMLHLNITKKATLTSTQPIEDNIDGEVTWSNSLSWKSESKPTMVAASTIAELFECFEVVEDPDPED